MGELFKNNSGPYVEPVEKPNQFLINWLPVEFRLKDKIAQRLLPSHIYGLYARWRHQELSGLLVDYISKSLGCSLNLRWREVGNNAPKYFDYEALVLGGEKGGRDEPISYGQSFSSAGEAESRCLGEFLERQFLEKIDINRTLVTTKKKLGRRAVNLQQMPLYLPWQVNINKSFVTRDDVDESTLTWVKAKSLVDRSNKYVPADRVFWGQFDLRSKSVNQPTSNGNGGGFSYEAAVLSGLYELVERDSFMCHWLLKLPATVIEIDETAGQPLQEKLKIAVRYSMEVIFLDITTTVNIPTVMCVILDRHDKNDVKISVGAATGYDLDRIFEKSYLEALAVMRRHWFSDNLPAQVPVLSTRGLFDNIGFDDKDWEIRLDRYRGVAAEKDMGFLFEGSRTSFKDFCVKYKKGFRSQKDEFKSVRNLFRNLLPTMPGMHPYIYEVQDDARLLRSLGYRVVSVVVLQLFPLYLTEHRATLDVSALLHWRQTALKMGQEWTGEIKNTSPHPFP